MSFDGYKSTIEEGDKVVLVMKNKRTLAIDVNTEIKTKLGIMVENIIQTTAGSLRVRNLIGKKYGIRMELAKGFVDVLPPTPELWTLALPHRTQIIYTPDISMIVFQLNLSPGCIVIEAGTGSGSLSHAFIRTIKPSGHLYTFDFHEQRSNVAKTEFEKHGLKQYVTAQQRDVCENGFGDDLNGKADAVFLDLPHPWLGVPHSVKATKTMGGRFCSFSPCIEQVQKTSLALKDNGYLDITTLEVLQVEYEIEQKSLLVRDLDFLQSEKTDDKSEKTPSRKTNYIIATPPDSMPGHTGFLTVATLPPIWARNSHNEEGAI